MKWQKVTQALLLTSVKCGSQDLGVCHQYVLNGKISDRCSNCATHDNENYKVKMSTSTKIILQTTFGPPNCNRECNPLTFKSTKCNHTPGLPQFDLNDAPSVNLQRQRIYAVKRNETGAIPLVKRLHPIKPTAQLFINHGFSQGASVYPIEEFPTLAEILERVRKEKKKKQEDLHEDLHEKGIVYAKLSLQRVLKAEEIELLDKLKKSFVVQDHVAKVAATIHFVFRAAKSVENDPLRGIYFVNHKVLRFATPDDGNEVIKETFLAIPTKIFKHEMKSMIFRFDGFDYRQWMTPKPHELADGRNVINAYPPFTNKTLEEGSWITETAIATKITRVMLSEKEVQSLAAKELQKKRKATPNVQVVQKWKKQ